MVICFSFFLQGHSESKGAKKREKSVGGGGGGNGNKPSRGVATSFGFRRRPASSSRADDNARRKKAHDKNGNGGKYNSLFLDLSLFYYLLTVLLCLTC